MSLLWAALPKPAQGALLDQISGPRSGAFEGGHGMGRRLEGAPTLNILGRTGKAIAPEGPNHQGEQ